MTTWEYRVYAAEIVQRWSEKKQAEEVAAFQQRLNGLGTKGWEMVSFDTVPLTGHFSSNIKGLRLPDFLQTAHRCLAIARALYPSAATHTSGHPYINGTMPPARLRRACRPTCA
jgi:hypothetical protein